MRTEQAVIRTFDDGDLAVIVDLSLLAWEPAFDSMEKVLGPAIYSILWPDWEKMPASLPDADRAQRQAEGALQAPAERRTSTTRWLPSSMAASSVSSPTS